MNCKVLQSPDVNYGMLPFVGILISAVQKRGLKFLPSGVSTARADLPHVREASLQEDHGQPGPVPAPLQRDPAVGGHRGVSVHPAQQEGAALQEVHQDRRSVSLLLLLFLLSPRTPSHPVERDPHGLVLVPTQGQTAGRSTEGFTVL